MNRLKLLDLFCRAGGASMGYHRAGFEVYGVDIEPQPSYPYGFAQRDALYVLYCLTHNGGTRYVRPDGRSEFLKLDDFSVITASPPCQHYSTITGPGRDKHPDLVGPVRELLEATGLPYIIENVPQAPLHDPVILCGSSFGLAVRRHRGFESNRPLHGLPCDHATQGRPVGVYGQHPDRKQHFRPDGTQRGTKAIDVNHARTAMGIDWMDWPDLAEAIPPAYTEHLGRQLLESVEAVA